MRHAVRVAGGAVVVSALVAGCSASSHSAAVGPASPAGTTAVNTSTAAGSVLASPGPSSPVPSPGAAGTGTPSTAAPTTTAGSASAPTSTAGRTTTSAPATTAAGTTATKPPGTGINNNDPALKALAAWLTQAAKTINAGKPDTPALDALMTSTLRKDIGAVLNDDKGLYYPGPVPYTVTAVDSPGPGQRRVHVCVVAEGFAQNPKTHKPARALRVSSARADLVVSNGRWLVNHFYAPMPGSCSGVRVAMPTW